MKNRLLSLLVFMGFIISVNGQIEAPLDKYKNVGNSVIIKDHFAYIGDPSLSTNEISPSAVVIFRKEKDVWSHYYTLQERKGVGNTYGKCVAHSGGTLFVSDDENNQVHLYHRSSGYELRFDILSPEYPLKERNFGRSIVSTDDYLFVSYVQKAQGMNSAKGCIDIYHHKGRLWFKVDELRSPDNFDPEGFGTVMDVENDLLVVSSNKSIQNNKKGSVCVYKLEGQKWEYKQQLTIPESKKMNGFGYSLNLNKNRLFVSESQIKKFDKKNDKYDFQRENFFLGGKVHCYSSIVELEINFKLDTVIEAPGEDGMNGFGSSISSVDNKLFVSAYQGIAKKGKVFLYEYGCEEVWNLKNVVKSQNPDKEKQFGFSIFASASELMVGAKRASYSSGTDKFDPENLGMAYFYSYINESDFVGQLKETHELQYKSPSGKMFYKSEIFTDTITTVDGCDSLIHIDLTIINKDAVVLDKKGNVVKTIAVTPFLESDKVIHKTKFVKRVEVERRIIRLEYFDQGSVDNDTVSIKFNDNWLVLDQELTREKHIVTIELEEGENSVIFRAENIGSEYPNTSRVEVFNQDDKLILFTNMKSDLNESSFLIFNYTPKKD